MIKRVIVAIFICLIAVLSLTGCDTNTGSNVINVNVEENNTISGNKFGKSALIAIGDGLWYDATTRIVYWWNGFLNTYNYTTTPSPYYAPNGLPYRYNPETNTFEEIKENL